MVYKLSFSLTYSYEIGLTSSLKDDYDLLLTQLWSYFLWRRLLFGFSVTNSHIHSF